MRGGGASFLYAMDVPLQRIQWLGRWAQQRTLEIYVQEVATMRFLDSLSGIAADKVQMFAKHAAQLMKRRCGS